MSWRQDPTAQPTQAQRTRARSLRRQLTEPEKRLWWHLRRRLSVEGSHFRRQVPIGPFVADFCCQAAKLVIEVDGEQHGFDVQRAHDERRTTYLADHGYRVLRFTNRDVMRSIDVVLETIWAALGPTTPTRRYAPPSPQGGGQIGGAL